MRERNGAHAQTWQRLECVIKRLDQSLNGFVIEALQDVLHFSAMAENSDVAIEDRAEPGGREVIAIEVRDADGGDVADGDAGAVEALGGRAWADAGIDEHDIARRR